METNFDTCKPSGELLSAPIRVVVQQPALPKYRVPFFKECASRGGINLVLYYGELDGLPNESPDGFEAHYEPLRVGKLGRQQVLWHSAQWRHFSRKEADVVVLSWNVRYLSLVPALLRAHSSNIPVILWGHGYSKSENACRLFLRKAVAKLATGLVFYGYRTARQYIANGWPEEMVFVAPNSLDQQAIQQAQTRWQGEPAKLADFQAQHRLLEGPVLIYTGRIYQQNRLDVLIRAMPHIAANQPHIRLIVIGNLNEHALAAKHLAAELKVNDLIRWLGAIYNEEALAPWMMSASLFCYPANIGLSIMHAMGYGLPVVTGDNLGRHNPEIEILKHGENGRLFSHGDPVSLADTVNELLVDRQRLKAMSLAARRSVEETYNIPQMVDGFLAAVRYAHEKRPRGWLG